MIDIQIRPYYKKKVQPDFLVDAAEAVLSAEKKTGNVSIVMTGNKEIHDLNRDYRHIDSPTDVLSFENGEVDPFNGELYLGDIIISVMKAETQAAAEGHSLEDELKLLTVHGTLHLLGYDHQSIADRKKMWQRQAEILNTLGIHPGTLDHLEKA
jgi:probable rRNA maturation factor